MTHPNPSTALARVVIDELVAGGMKHAIVAPGSRSGALAIAAAQSPDMETTVVIDERSAAFYALGLGKAGQSAAVISTSGTGTANFFPAVVEADTACVPLAVITADRPVEMRGVGANQTIVQTNLYGGKVRAAIEIPAPDQGADLNAFWRSALRPAIHQATAHPPGPVHVNVAFHEPTVPVGDDGRSVSAPYLFDTPRLEFEPERAAPAGLGLPAVGDGRGLIIAGDGEYDRDALLSCAAKLNWPVLGTALSSIRRPGVVTTYHHLLAGGVPEILRPETVVAVGGIGPSQSLEALISSASQRIRVDAWGRTFDPRRNATHIVHGEVVELLGGLVAADERWPEDWRQADAAMREKLVIGLTQGGITGGAVAHALNGLEMGALVVASSLPVREVDAHFVDTVPVFGNRGASGIDGFVSTALGVATVMPRTLALAGDLSLLHDSNGFLNDRRSDLVIVVLDNNGGGLFDSLPQARHAPQFERLFVTPPERDLEVLARFHSLAFEDVVDVTELARVVNTALSRGGISIVRVGVDRAHDVAVRTGLGL